MESSLKKTIDSWIEEIMTESDDRLSFIGEVAFDDSSGWGKTLKRYLNNTKVEIEEKRGFLFTGPLGSGRHQAAYHVIQCMCVDRADEVRLLDNYKAVFLSGDDFRDIPREHIRMYLDGLFGKIEAPMCVVLEEPESAAEYKTLLKAFGRIICHRYTFVDDYEHLLPIVITQDDKYIPNILRERLTLCRMTLPNVQQRRNLICNLENEEEEDSDLLKVLQDDMAAISVDQFITMTEGLNYGEIRDIIETGSMYLKISSDQSENFRLFINSQLINEDDDYPAAESAADRLHERLITFIDEIPELIEKLPAGNTIDLSLLQTKAEESKEEENVKSEADKYSNMTVFDENAVKNETEKMNNRELVNDIFGDKSDAIIELAQNNV